MTEDQAHEAVARGLFTVPRMQQLLGWPPLNHKEHLRKLLLAAAETAELHAAEAAKTAAAEAKAAVETKASAEA